MDIVKLITTSSSVIRMALLSLLFVAIQGCSGGSDAPDTPRAAQTSGLTSATFVYSGPVPANSAVQSFKTAFYDNLVDRCGSCHTSGGSAPTPFVDKDDVNVAYNAALTVVDLLNPPASEVVSKVGGGHNCWETSDALCASTIEGYIYNWVSSASPSAGSVTLTPRSPQTLSGLKIAPQTYSDAVAQVSFDLTAEPELLYLLQTHCSGCHTGSSSTPQSPYFASSDPNIAYPAMLGKIDLATPGNSRLVIRLQGQHNCWSGSTGCASDALAMENAIARFAADLPVVSVDPNLVISEGQILTQDGIVASGGGRFESDVIAKWEFREGIGTQTADTSGVQPEIPLTAFGNYSWVGGWGMRLEGGRLQASVSQSTKLHDRLTSSGEYTLETWIAPLNVAQNGSWIFAYAGGPNDRNLLLTQSMYNYDFYNRSTANPVNDGSPAASTLDADEFAQATLQHVVLVYNPFNGGRKIYVNGVDTLAPEAVVTGGLSNWSSNFALTIGSNFAGTSIWEGVVRMMAVHSRALTPAQIQQNYDVGVGQKYYLMFSISSILDQEGVCHVIDPISSARTDYCYIVFEVSQFDSTSYLFKEPRFVTINPSAASTSLNFDLKGIYLGMNGQLVRNGQAFVNIDTTISGSVFTIDDPPLQTTGTIVPLENGPDADVFFLAFEEIDGNIDGTTNPTPGAFAYTYQDQEQIQIGMRTFDETNESFSHLTGVPKDSAAVSSATGKTVSETYDSVRRSLASVGDFQTFMASHQMAVMQLAAAYCDALVEDTTLRSGFFNDGSAFDFSAAVESVTDPVWSSQVIYPLIDRVYATGLDSQPTRPDDGDDFDGKADRDDLHAELLDLITNPVDESGFERVPDGKADGLKYCTTATCPAGRTAEVVKAVCTAVLSSAAATVK